MLRPLLSVHWLEKYTTPAPIEFDRLLHRLDGDTAMPDAIAALLERKRAAPELGLSAPVACINEFIERELARLERLVPTPSAREKSAAPLDALFRRCLAAAWNTEPA